MVKSVDDPESAPCRATRQRGGALVEYTIVLSFVGVMALGMSDLLVNYTTQQRLRLESNNLTASAPAFTQLPP